MIHILHTRSVLTKFFLFHSFSLDSFQMFETNIVGCSRAVDHKDTFFYLLAIKNSNMAAEFLMTVEKVNNAKFNFHLFWLIFTTFFRITFTA